MPSGRQREPAVVAQAGASGRARLRGGSRPGSPVRTRVERSSSRKGTTQNVGCPSSKGHFAQAKGANGTGDGTNAWNATGKAAAYGDYFHAEPYDGGYIHDEPYGGDYFHADPYCGNYFKTELFKRDCARLELQSRSTEAANDWGLETSRRTSPTSSTRDARARWKSDTGLHAQVRGRTSSRKRTDGWRSFRCGVATSGEASQASATTSYGGGRRCTCYSGSW